MNIEKTFLPLQPNIKQPKNPAYEKNVKKNLLEKIPEKNFGAIPLFEKNFFRKFVDKNFCKKLWKKIFQGNPKTRLKISGKKFF